LITPPLLRPDDTARRNVRREAPGVRAKLIMMTSRRRPSKLILQPDGSALKIARQDQDKRRLLPKLHNPAPFRAELARRWDIASFPPKDIK
jgi:hypothetical protein